MFVSGASSSVVRATIMATLTLLAEIFYQKSDTISNISFSAFILMLISPLIVYDVGFVLSFGGTLGIVLLSKDFEKYFKKYGKLSETLATTCSAQIVLAPIMAFYFNTFSILSIITNLIVVPISGAITILGFIVFLLSKIYFPLAKIFSYPLYVLSHFTIFVSYILSQIPFSNIKIITPNITEIILFYFVVFFLTGKINLPLMKNSGKMINIKENQKIKIVVAVVGVFLAIEMIYYYFPRNYIQVNCIDVGQGDAIYIQTKHHKNILIDG